MKIFWLTLIAGFLSWSASADQTQALPPSLGDYIQNSLNSVSPGVPQTSCLGEQGSPVSTMLGFMHYVCQGVEQEKQSVDDVLKKALQLGADRTLKENAVFDFNQFADSFRYFWKINSQIPALYGKPPKNAWDEQFTEALNLKPSKCEYRVGRKGATKPLQEMQFGDVHFLGIQHFYSIQSSQKIHAANELLDDRLEKIETTAATGQQPPYTYILLEGHHVKYGQALSCESVLYSVFRGDREGDHDEQINLLRYGFLTKTPLIPADNQYLSDSDRDSFYGGDSAKFEKLKKDFDFVDILHNYFSSLNDAFMSHKHITSDEALAQAIDKTHSKYFDATAFKSQYMAENKSVLPSDLQKLQLAFTPSASLPPWARVAGSNRLVDEQDILRNRALIRAIQISEQNFGKATVIFGSGHLEKIGSILEKEVGSPKNIDFLDACPARK